MKNSIKREQSQTGLNSAERENFRLKGKQQNVFIDNLQMETQTVFMQNGNINIYPCAFELGQHIVAGGDSASQKGRMVTDESGTSHFRAYAKDSGSRYTHLFETTNGEVKRTKRHLIVKLVLPLGIGRIAIIEALMQQIHEIVNYIKSLKENTIWS